MSGIDYLSAGLSHEWIEASSDPFYESRPAYNGPAAKYNAWTLLTGGEVADMCTLSPTAYIRPDNFPFKVQRSWSNASALAAHDPCVPVPATPYFVAAPRMTELLQGSLQGQALAVEGIKIPLGHTSTVEVDLFSDAPIDGGWQVSALDYGETSGIGANLRFAWDKQQGVNGDKLQLTVTRMKDDPNMPGVDIFVLLSTLGSTQNYWIGAVGD